MSTKIKNKQIASGNSPYGYGLVSDGSGNTFFTNLGEIDAVINAGTLSLNWNFNTDITDSNPNNGNFKRNSNNPLTTTFLYYNILSSDNVDATNFLLKLTQGDYLYFQEFGDANTFEYYEITGTPINSTTYVKIPVALYDNGTIILNKNNTKCGHIFFFTGARGIRKGTTFPTTATEGDVFYRTDIDLIYQYDSTRLKWLSVDRQSFSCARNLLRGNVSGYFGIHDVIMTSTEGLKMSKNGTIISATFVNSTTLTRTIELRINNSTTNKFDLILTASNNIVSNIINLDFNSGDIIQVFANVATNTDDIVRGVVTFEIAWRE